MTGRKIGLVAVLAIVAIVSTAYGIHEAVPPVTVMGHGQLNNQTFEERVDTAGIVVLGKITGLDVKLFTKEIIDIDENGDKYVFRTDRVPMREVTITISEVLKDNFGLTTDTVTVYDRHVYGEIGISDGHKAVYRHEYSTDYQLGDEGLFLIENDHGLYLFGFADYHPIIEGQSTITSEYDKMFHREPIDITDAKDIVKLNVQG